MLCMQCPLLQGHQPHDRLDVSPCKWTPTVHHHPLSPLNDLSLAFISSSSDYEPEKCVSRCTHRASFTFVLQLVMYAFSYSLQLVTQAFNKYVEKYSIILIVQHTKCDSNLISQTKTPALSVCPCSLMLRACFDEWYKNVSPLCYCQCQCQHWLTKVCHKHFCTHMHDCAVEGSKVLRGTHSGDDS